MKSYEAQRLLDLQSTEEQHLDQFYNDAVRFHFINSTYLPAHLFIEIVQKYEPCISEPNVMRIISEASQKRERNQNLRSQLFVAKIVERLDKDLAKDALRVISDQRIKRLQGIFKQMQDPKVEDKIIKFASSVVKPPESDDSLVRIIEDVIGLNQSKKQNEENKLNLLSADKEKLTFQLKVLEEAIRNKKDKQYSNQAGHIAAIIRHLRMIYNLEVIDDSGQEIPLTIHQLHELLANYFVDRARVNSLIQINERKRADLFEIADLRDKLKKSENRILQLEKNLTDGTLPADSLKEQLKINIPSKNSFELPPQTFAQDTQRVYANQESEASESNQGSEKGYDFALSLVRHNNEGFNETGQFIQDQQNATFGVSQKKNKIIMMKEFNDEKEQLQELSSLKNLDFSKFVKLDKPKNIKESIDESFVESIDISKIPYVDINHPKDYEMLNEATKDENMDLYIDQIRQNEKIQKGNEVKINFQHYVQLMARIVQQQDMSFSVLAKLIITERFIYLFNFNLSNGQRSQKLMFALSAEAIESPVTNFGKYKENLVIKLKEAAKFYSGQTELSTVKIFLKFPNQEGYKKIIQKFQPALNKMKNSVQLPGGLKVLTSNLENYFIYKPSLSKSPCKGTIHEVSIKTEGGIWNVSLVKSRSSIPKSDPATFEGYINFLDKSKEKKSYMKEMTRYFVFRVSHEELDKDIEYHKPIMKIARERNFTVKTPIAKDNMTILGFMEQDFNDGLTTKDEKESKLSWMQFDNETMKKILTKNAILEIFNEDQFPDQDEPEGVYQLKDFSRKISMVIKPEGQYGSSSVLELPHNKKDYSIFIGKIDSGTIDNVNYSEKHEVFDKIKKDLLHFSAQK